MIFERSVKVHEVKEQRKDALSIDENMTMGMEISISLSCLRNFK